MSAFLVRAAILRRVSGVGDFWAKRFFRWLTLSVCSL